MSPTNNRFKVSRLIGWLVAVLLLAFAWWVVLERQFVVDTLQYYQYEPTSEVKEITSKLELTDDAKFMFYASHPSVEGSDTFNTYCPRQEANSPILGCYANRRIHLYDVTDERLDGIQEVTAAHELLHAEYERLSDAEKERLRPLLDATYKRLADDELTSRMEYYERTQPGEMYNELHSIIPTEFADIGDELEKYYAEYFMNRRAIVEIHAKVSSQFTELSKEADGLVAKINELVASINSNTQAYNSGVLALNQKVVAFNARASQSGGFTSQSEFAREKSALEAERSQLESLRAQVNADTATHQQLIAQLNSINARTESLNESIDSVLSDEPEI